MAGLVVLSSRTVRQPRHPLSQLDEQIQQPGIRDPGDRARKAAIRLAACGESKDQFELVACGPHHWPDVVNPDVVSLREVEFALVACISLRYSAHRTCCS
jgi:hypothetical protein